MKKKITYNASEVDVKFNVHLTSPIKAMLTTNDFHCQPENKFITIFHNLLESYSWIVNASVLGRIENCNEHDRNVPFCIICIYLRSSNAHHIFCDTKMFITKKICLNGSSICWIFFLVAVLYFTCNRTSNMCCEHVFFIPILSTEPPSSPCHACMVWGRCAAIQFTNALAFVFISKKPSYRVSMGMLSGWRRTNGSSATKCLRSSSIASTLAMCLSLCVWMMLKNVCIIHWIVVCCAIQASLTILSSQFSPHFIFCTQSHVVYDCWVLASARWMT